LRARENVELFSAKKFETILFFDAALACIQGDKKSVYLKIVSFRSVIKKKSQQMLISCNAVTKLKELV